MDNESSPHRLSAQQVMLGDSREIDYIDAYAKAVSEWEQIESLPIICVSPENQRVPGEEIEADKTASTPKDESGPRTTSELDVIEEYIRTTDIGKESLLVVCHPQKSFIARIARKLLFLGPKPIKRKLKSDRNRIFALAHRSYDNADPIHIKMLTALYRGLRQEPTAKCPRIGSHWEEIGFQGIDPASDLRGVGILGLYQLAFLVLSSQTSALAGDIYHLSTAKCSDFPFCIMGLNLTQIALHHLREGSLNREMNQTLDPLLTFNLFYASLFLKLFNLWRDKNCTVADTGFVLRDLKQSTGSSVRKSILSITNYDVTRPKEDAGSKEVLVFSDIGNIVDPGSKDKEGEGEENLV